MPNLQDIINHFTDLSAVEVFVGFDSRGRGMTKAMVPSPLAFYHDSERHQRDQDDDPMQSYCPSCGIMQRAMRLPEMNKTEAKKAIKWIRDTMKAEFLNDNPEAEADIEAALAEELRKREGA